MLSFRMTNTDHNIIKKPISYAYFNLERISYHLKKHTRYTIFYNTLHNTLKRCASCKNDRKQKPIVIKNQMFQIELQLQKA